MIHVFISLNFDKYSLQLIEHQIQCHRKLEYYLKQTNKTILNGVRPIQHRDTLILNQVLVLLAVWADAESCW